jgi:type IV pilus assembly protein PilC
MVRAGEEGGDISGALHTVGDQMERMYTLKKKVRGAMLYPSIVLIAIIGVSVLMITQVVPTLAQTFRELNADLPASTQSMITVSDFLINHSVVAIVVFTVAFSTMLKTSWGRRGKDWVFIHMPLIGGLVKEVNAARTARTMASLLGSGVDMLTSLSITRDVVQNTFFKEVIAEALEKVQQGEPLSKTFLKSEHLYPPLVGEMMSVGEETGDIKTMLQNMALFYEEEVSRKTKDMSTIIEPFLMLIIGGAVGFFAISMVSPIYSLSDAI